MSKSVSFMSVVGSSKLNMPAYKALSRVQHVLVTIVAQQWSDRKKYDEFSGKKLYH